MVRVVVADDHPLFLGGVVRAIGDAVDLDLVHVATTGAEALQAITDHQPDVALLDMRLPQLTGLEVLGQLGPETPTAVVFLSAYADGASVHQALTAGAAGYVSKEADDETIREAVRAAANGQTAISTELQRLVFSEIRTQGAAPVIPALSDREREVLQRVADGQSAPQIGGELHLSPATVKTYLARVYEKLGVTDRAAATAAAVRHGLIQ